MTNIGRNQEGPLNRGRKPVEHERIDVRIQLWVTPSFRRQMEREAIDAGYASVSNYVREKKLGCRVPTASNNILAQ